MIWLELRTNNTKYNEGWNLLESVWAPITKSNGVKWPFWGLVGNVIKGDIIFHLTKDSGKKRFLGYSVANTDGYLTYDKPNNIHDWDFSKAFYKVDLIDFKPLYPSVELADFFNKNDVVLRDYFHNKAEKRLFYTIQKNKLQCLFGAYFSEFNDIFPSMVVDDYIGKVKGLNIADNTNTGVAFREVEQRIGHQIFSDNVKINFNSKCCFPECEVEGRGFLVSGHIARWVDDESLRGHTGNGLCFCLMHDKAFEKGIFTLDENLRIVIVNRDFTSKEWLKKLLLHGENKEIKPRQINPLVEALKLHWKRIGYMGS